MEELLNDIVSYLCYLEKELKLNISIHFANEVLGAIPKDGFEKLLPFNVHKNYYCVVVKRTRREACLCLQQDILHRADCGTSFCNVCHAGVEEYIQQIKSDNKILGYISVSGYRGNKAPVGCTDNVAWSNCLLAEKIPVQTLDALISPLRRMFEQLLICPMLHADQSEYNMILQFLYECAGQVTLEDICQRFGRSKSYISHLFNAHSQLSLPAYCNMLKLNHAKQLLSFENASVTEVAFDAGYQDVSYFIRQFKNQFGITPLQYRKSIK